jgi:hypothetical protein
LTNITRPPYSFSSGRLTTRVTRSAAPTLRLTDPPRSPTDRSSLTLGGSAVFTPPSTDQPWLPLAPWPAMPSDIPRVTVLTSSLSRSKCTELPSASTSAVIRGIAKTVTSAVRITALRQLCRVKDMPAAGAGASGSSTNAAPSWTSESKCDSRPSPLTILWNRSRLSIVASVSRWTTSS